MGNDVYICKMAEVFEKRLKYMVNDVDLWEISEISWEVASLSDNRLKMWKMT